MSAPVDLVWVLVLPALVGLACSGGYGGIVAPLKPCALPAPVWGLSEGIIKPGKLYRLPGVLNVSSV